jgi:hypothetical protein
VLNPLTNWLKNPLANDVVLYVDLPGYKQPSLLFNRYKPDISLVLDRSILILELTICHESNLNKSKEYKARKYLEIGSDIKSEFNHYDVTVHTIEVSTLGFISCAKDFVDKAKVAKMSLKQKNDIIATVLNYSFWIYRNRNSQSDAFAVHVTNTV